MSKHLTKSEIVVSLQRCLKLNKTTKQQQKIVTTKKQREMKETTLKYTRGDINYTLCIFPGVFTNLVRRKIKTEHIEEYEAILSVLQDIIASLTLVDSYYFEFVDKEGFKHIISGRVTE